LRVKHNQRYHSCAMQQWNEGGLAKAVARLFTLQQRRKSAKLRKV
jgi:hypothetical protein